jgi:HlyD family secretion protein
VVKAGTKAASATSPASVAPAQPPTATNASPANRSDASLVVSGYIINRERIEISPRFMGVVTWIGVKKGDTVTNGQVVVLLDDTEYRARLRQAEGALASARSALEKAELDLDRVQKLAEIAIASQEAKDNARLGVESAKALLKETEGVRDLAQTYLDWCTIRSPINGVVLERLVDSNELVVPQSFGGTRGPSTALIAVADPQDLQVEIDLNEADLSRISLRQPCRVSPEAYLDKVYEGYVTEIAPEANRAKGTLQIKVQVRNPDKYLTPELSAKVEFLK